MILIFGTSLGAFTSNSGTEEQEIRENYVPLFLLDLDSLFFVLRLFTYYCHLLFSPGIIQRIRSDDSSGAGGPVGIGAGYDQLWKEGEIGIPAQLPFPPSFQALLSTLESTAGFQKCIFVKQGTIIAVSVTFSRWGKSLLVLQTGKCL